MSEVVGPYEIECKDLGCATSIEVIEDLVPLDGQFVVDVGCGDMTFSRCLAGRAGRVLAIDPDPAQADLNRAADRLANVEFVEAGADALPVPGGSVDGIFFSYSLHHVPASVYPEVFAEVARALKPGGYLCVIEPTGCPLNEVMKLFHDEDHVRAEAQTALVRLAVPAFERHSVFRYHSFVQYDSFDAFAGEHGSRTFNPGYTEADVRRSDVAEAFVRLASADGQWVSPKQMVLLQSPRSP